MARDNNHRFRLLCNINELTALLTGTGNIEDFLQQTAEMVARHFETDVCSIYLFDEAMNELVLKATVGLNPQAIGVIRMKLGEGLVGTAMDILEAVCEGCASKNQKFKYFEEAGEDRLESFLAVPILKGVERIGVLVVQNEKRDFFDELDVMALKAIASQLAGAIENARLLMNIALDRQVVSAPTVYERLRFIKGEGVSPGYVLGPSTVFRRNPINFLVESPDDSAATIADFHRALKVTSDQLQELQARLPERLEESDAMIFTSHFMILKDDVFINKILERIEKGLTPAEAIRTVARHYMAIFSSSHHGYIKEKVNDLEDLTLRILNNLKGGTADDTSFLKGRIVISQDLYPSEILRLASEEVTGIVLTSGGITSHVAILSRSLQIPLVIADHPEFLELPDDTLILVDGDIGNIYVCPSPWIINQFKSREEGRRIAKERRQAISEVTRTKDGALIKLLANINLLRELDLTNELKLEGIGLYRTEFPFLIRSNFPSEEEQYLIYKKVFDAMRGREVTIRTLDIGGDKILAYSDISGETNPDLGLKSIRFTLRHRDVFEQQIRAILRAAAEAPVLKIMFPMITSLDEFREARQIIMNAMNTMDRLNIDHHDRPMIGILIEVPSVMEIISELTAEADFLSIGTNDFIQYMLAVDRSNEKVAHYYRPNHPAILRSIARIVRSAEQREKEISICGEMAHMPEYVPFFIGVGVRRLSIDPQFVYLVQDLIGNFTIAQADEYARRLLAKTTIKETQRIIDKGIMG
ncbi:MAG: phosphoenolpyruvate--protein phosphotransferase [Deltaproteobacteria bacterium]|nr:phosphoenolpyruvate--protein phosphotransferase [Deltaproteobacteria bacterium]